MRRRNLVTSLIAWVARARGTTRVAGFRISLPSAPSGATWGSRAETAKESHSSTQKSLHRFPIGGGRHRAWVLIRTNQNVAPVTVPGTVERGDGIHVPANLMTLRPASPAMVKRLKPAYELLDNAVADGAFPSGVLAVGLHDELIVHPFGRLTRDAKSPAVTADTIYDVASLTKPIVTTTAIMRLVQRGELSLDAPVVRFLPEWAKAAPSDPDPPWRARVTVRMLLFHDSAYHLAGLDQRYGTPGCIEDYYDP